MYHGEEEGINRNQIRGSRPGRTTHDSLTIVTLSEDLARLERLAMITIFNDTAGCYDIMLRNLMDITTRRMGYPKAAALCHAQVLNQIKHFIKTVNGISQDYIQASDEIPLA